MPKFDVIVGNPPYLKNFHLKMLRRSYNCLNDTGCLVFIHPARWIQDPLGPLKKNSDFNKMKDIPFQDFKIISFDRASEIFGVRFFTDLSITTINKATSPINLTDIAFDLKFGKDDNDIYKNIFKKVLEYSPSFVNSHITKNELQRYSVILREIIGNPLCKKYDLISTNHNHTYSNGMCPNNKTFLENRRVDAIAQPKTVSYNIQFDTYEEAENFRLSTFTDVYKFFVSIVLTDQHPKFAYYPFMLDYSKPWDNERFCKHFHITTEELEFIKDRIKPYMY